MIPEHRFPERDVRQSLLLSSWAVIGASRRGSLASKRGDLVPRLPTAPRCGRVARREIADV